MTDSGIEVWINHNGQWVQAQDGQVLPVDVSALAQVHPAQTCAGSSCVLHNPSSHHMRDWPLTWRNDRQLMERRCPHGIGHPDPDDARYQRQHGRDVGVHGCDGCCALADPTPR